MKKKIKDKIKIEKKEFIVCRKCNEVIYVHKDLRICPKCNEVITSVL